jgi:hypothetical protein
MSDEWQFPRITDFWEYRTKAVVSGADQLAKLAGDDRARSLAKLGEQVRTHTRGLDDSWLVTVAFMMAEDLYKSLFGGFYWSGDVADYLGASAGVFMQEFTQRGYVLHYIIDNMASPEELRVMLTYVPAIFRAAGLPVLGPQLMALEMMAQNGQSKDVAAIPSYLAQAQTVADAVVRSCQKERRSHVFLNLDLDDGSPARSLDVALSGRDQPGTIVVFRNQPPVAGTTAQVTPPPGVTLPL